MQGLRIAAMAALLAAQVAAQTVEWPTFGNDRANTKYSPLDQIDRTNFDAARGRLDVGVDLAPGHRGERSRLGWPVQSHPDHARRPGLRGHRGVAGRGDRCGHRQDSLGARSRGVQGRPPGQSGLPASGCRGLEGPYRRAGARADPGLHRDPRPQAGGSRRQDRRAGGRLRHRRRRRPAARPGPAALRPPRQSAQHHAQLTSCHRRQHDHRRLDHQRRSHSQGGSARTRSRLRRTHREDEVDLPHHSPGG